MIYERSESTQKLETVRVGHAAFGGRRVTLIAGPCSVESRAQMLETAAAAKEAGASMLRGGAFKPRTSPYSFQGLWGKGLEILAEAREATGLPVVTEVLETCQLAEVAAAADMLQIGSRNMQNSVLLRAAGASGKPVLLKRGMGSTSQEFLLAAEYILKEGNRRVVLCERGIRTFENSTRFTLDLQAVPWLKQRTWMPVIVDPSHAAGDSALVPPMSAAAIAAGADGLIIEIHCHPKKALCDGNQAVTPEALYALVKRVKAVAEAVGRTYLLLRNKE